MLQSPGLRVLSGLRLQTGTVVQSCWKEQPWLQLSSWIRSLEALLWRWKSVYFGGRQTLKSKFLCKSVKFLNISYFNNFKTLVNQNTHTHTHTHTHNLLSYRFHSTNEHTAIRILQYLVWISVLIPWGLKF